VAAPPVHGNLLSYRLYTRPRSQAAYGHGRPRTARELNAQRILGALAARGASTAWEIAKVRFPNDNEHSRRKEKEFRRILQGRTDRGRHSPGMGDSGLVYTEEEGGTARYRLTPHGMLYCVDSLGLGDTQVDRMAAAYADAVPRVFGRWDELKGALGDGAYKLRILARGILLDNPAIPRHPTSPIYELMSYLQLKYHRNFEVMREADLAEQVSYWYYTYILYDPTPTAARAKARVRLLTEALGDMHGWYARFVREANAHYRDRARAIGASGLLA